jgi:hypothetical protein
MDELDRGALVQDASGCPLLNGMLAPSGNVTGSVTPASSSARCVAIALWPSTVWISAGAHSTARSIASGSSRPCGKAS